MCVTVGLAMGATGCTAVRPDPTDVVTEYLEAIAAGDAATATQLDATGLNDVDREWADLDTLRTDDVLAGAERITDVVVDPETTGDDTAKQVSFSYELAGQQERSAIDVVWDEDAQKWQLADSLASPLTVLAAVNRTEQRLVSFDLPGASVRQPADQDAATLVFLVYPAVYSITADLDPALLADPAAELTQVVPVMLSQQPVAQYTVTQLP